MNDCYVYGYVRAKDGQHGMAGSFYYIGKGCKWRKINTHDTVKVPKDRTKIVTIASGLSEVDALQAEMFLIHLYGRVDLGTGCLRNRTDGGDGGGLGMIQSPESIAKRTAANTGKVRSQEFRDYMSRLANERAKDPNYIAKLSKANTGNTLSQAARNKIRAKHVGTTASPETRKKMSEAHKRFWALKKAA